MKKIYSMFGILLLASIGLVSCNDNNEWNNWLQPYAFTHDPALKQVDLSFFMSSSKDQISLEGDTFDLTIEPKEKFTQDCSHPLCVHLEDVTFDSSPNIVAVFMSSEKGVDQTSGTPYLSSRYSPVVMERVGDALRITLTKEQLRHLRVSAPNVNLDIAILVGDKWGALEKKIAIVPSTPVVSAP